MKKFDTWFEQFRPLDGRFETMKKALEIISDLSGGNIVETGTTRMKDDWGAGMSTFVFGMYCKELSPGTRVFTIDNTQKHMDICKEITEPYKDYIQYIVDDSLNALTAFYEPIHLLYLDSVDCPIEIKTEDDEKQLFFSQQHQLKEIQIGLPKVAPYGLVLLDDNAFTHGGKTALSKGFLANQGWKEVLAGQQSLWRKV